MPKSLKPGDRVSWQTSQGKTEGTVKEKVTSPTRVKGHTAKASPDNPEYVVKSAKSGKEGVHKPGSLKDARRLSIEHEVAQDHGPGSVPAPALVSCRRVGHTAACPVNVAPRLRRPATGERIRLFASCARLRGGFSRSSTTGSISCCQRFPAMKIATWQP